MMRLVAHGGRYPSDQQAARGLMFVDQRGNLVGHAARNFRCGSSRGWIAVAICVDTLGLGHGMVCGDGLDCANRLITAVPSAWRVDGARMPEWSISICCSIDCSI